MTNMLEYKNSRTLISIERDKIDDNSIQGFLLEYSNELILIQYIYDFNLDGLMILRRNDITKIKSNATDILQTQLLKDEDLYKNVDFYVKLNLSDWGSILSNIKKDYGLVIIEDEKKEKGIFLIGKIETITKKSVEITHFTGTGTWGEVPTPIDFNDITSCQVNTNYINVYQRYFEKIKGDGGFKK